MFILSQDIVICDPYSFIKLGSNVTQNDWIYSDYGKQMDLLGFENQYLTFQINSDDNNFVVRYRYKDKLIGFFKTQKGIYGVYNKNDIKKYNNDFNFKKAIVLKNFFGSLEIEDTGIVGVSDDVDSFYIKVQK